MEMACGAHALDRIDRQPIGQIEGVELLMGPCNPA